MPLNIIVGATNLFVAVLIAAVSLPLIKGKIPPNPLYGVRLPKSFESEENWYHLNRYGGIVMVKWSAVIFAVGLASFVLPNNIVLQLGLLLAGPLLLLIACIQMLVYSRKL